MNWARAESGRADALEQTLRALGLREIERTLLEQHYRLEECASKRGQDLFNPKKGSIPARKDADASLYEDYLAWALEEWKKNELAGSFQHGVVANNKWKGEIDTALGIFLSSKDVAAFQKALVAAHTANGKG